MVSFLFTGFLFLESGMYGRKDETLFWIKQKMKREIGNKLILGRKEKGGGQEKKTVAIYQLKWFHFQNLSSSLRVVTFGDLKNQFRNRREGLRIEEKQNQNQNQINKDIQTETNSE